MSMGWVTASLAADERGARADPVFPEFESDAGAGGKRRGVAGVDLVRMEEEFAFVFAVEARVVW